jgi:acetyltransferase-like isoleucine patch superfamily enzyme
MFGPVPPGLAFLDLVCQRLLRVNGEYPFPVHFTSRVTGRVEIGRNVWISSAVSGGCYIQGNNGIEIADDTIFAPGVQIISANHRVGTLQESEPAPPVRIGKRCWLGANSIILPGVQLGEG